MDITPNMYIFRDGEGLCSLFLYEVSVRRDTIELDPI